VAGPAPPEAPGPAADPLLDRIANLAVEQASPGKKFRDEWRAKARPEQIPPDGRYRVWYLAGGRGGGKSWTGAHTLAEWVLSDPVPGEWGIVAPIYSDAWSVCVEGESGFLAALGTNVEEVKRGKSELVEYWHKSFAEIKMRSGHIIRVASAEDGGLRIQGKNLKGAWCIARGEPVLTSQGPVPVEDVRPGMRVWTRQGWKRVTATCLTRQNAELLRVTTADGASVRVTPEHRIWTQHAGWAEAQALHGGDVLEAWVPGSATSPAASGTAVTGAGPDGRADVFDLQVEDAHEFVAGGILVHNCDEIGLWDAWKTTWDESLKYAVRKGRSQIVATGTPKKSRKARELVRRLLSDPKVKKSRLRTLDNRANLSESFFDEVVGAAKGTRLEQQELEGMLLDDVEGALWTADGIDACRVDTAPDLLRVVVAIDPAVSNDEDSDETGIVVVGEAEGGHGFVLADYSMRGTPDACMRKAVWAYLHHSADKVIGEANNGGDYIGSLLHTVDPNVPYEKVIASRGKRVRAEPVSALYEQMRVHHVGIHTMLEEQMISWVPSDPGDSPDRVDALVWACAALRSLSSGSWLQAYGVKRCDACAKAFPEREGACPTCHPKAAGTVREPARILTSEPEVIGGWASAYGDFVRCPMCQRPYDKRRTEGKCPHCSRGATEFLKQHGKAAGFSTFGLGR
jgi:phage terminase large subunit-like protein